MRNHSSLAQSYLNFASNFAANFKGLRCSDGLTLHYFASIS